MSITPSLYTDLFVSFIHRVVGELACASLSGNRRAYTSCDEALNEAGSTSTLFKFLIQFGDLNQAIDASVEQLVTDEKFQTCFEEAIIIATKLYGLTHNANYATKLHKSTNSAEYVDDEKEEQTYDYDDLRNKVWDLYYLFIKIIGLGRICKTDQDYCMQKITEFEDLIVESMVADLE